jgi:GntR family transcriptional regulator
MSQHSEASSEQLAGRVIALERDSPIPLYRQIKQHLAGELAGADPRSDKFYTDSELCSMFGVSRMTVRQAVQELVAEGLVKRSRGVGTFILGRPLEEHLTPLVAFREQWVASGRPMAVELLTFETRPCPAGFAEDLAIDRNAPVRYVFRLRSAGEMPIALDHRYLPLALAAGVSQAEAASSILRALSGRFEFAYADIHLEATTAGDDEVRWLKVPRGAPLMMRRLRFVTKDDVTVLAGYTVYRADLVRYSIHMPLVGEVPGSVVRAEDQDHVVSLRREVAGPVHGS